MSHLSLYEQVMGTRYAQLPAAVQRFHRLSGHHLLHGWVQSDAPASASARVLAWCLGTPRSASQGLLRFELDASAGAEQWTRHFPARSMRSRLRLAGGQLEEHLGAARLSFELSATEGALEMKLTGMRWLGLTCPRWLLPRVVAEERGDADRLHFSVSAALPLVGAITRYRGHLDLGPQGAP